jgi:3-oxoacyl-(acyl-carrier-protein) synthase
LSDKVLDPELVKLLRETPSQKTAFILAAGNAHFAGVSVPTRTSRLSYTYRALPLTLTQVYAGRVAQACGAADHIITDSSACASSLKVLMDVQTLVRMYGFTRVIVLTVEDAVSNLVLEFFGEAKACLTEQRRVSEGIAPSAFDATNGGFYVGQGAAFAVFESAAGLAQSGFTPKAYLKGAFTAAEPCANALGQLDSGLGFVRAAEGAIELSGVPASAIRVVKTHGTGTASNNQAERAALATCLPGGFVATSFKPTIGHTMGASGLLETALLVDSMHAGVVPGIQNRTEDDRVFLSSDTPAPSPAFLALAAGMGNVYSAAVMSMEA